MAVEMSKTCLTCVRGSLSSRLDKCVECIREDKIGNSFPNYEADNEKIGKLVNQLSDVHG